VGGEGLANPSGNKARPSKDLSKDLTGRDLKSIKSKRVKPEHRPVIGEKPGLTFEEKTSNDGDLKEWKIGGREEGEAPWIHVPTLDWVPGPGKREVSPATEKRRGENLGQKSNAREKKENARDGINSIEVPWSFRDGGASLKG